MRFFRKNYARAGNTARRPQPNAGPISGIGPALAARQSAVVAQELRLYFFSLS